MNHINGTMIYRAWDAEGYREIEQPFDSLETLFALCVQLDGSRLIDRIAIKGTDEAGEACQVTFAFAALTRGEGEAPE